MAELYRTPRPAAGETVVTFRVRYSSASGGFRRSKLFDNEVEALHEIDRQRQRGRTVFALTKATIEGLPLPPETEEAF